MELMPSSCGSHGRHGRHGFFGFPSDGMTVVDDRGTSWDAVTVWL